MVGIKIRHFVSFLLMSCFIFLAVGSGDDSPKSSKPDSMDAWTMAKQFVKKKLKSPSSAEFP